MTGSECTTAFNLFCTFQPVVVSYLDISETASDAWSTDVMPSDTDRLQEIDTDDTGSMTTARSDDTARSEVDGDVFTIPSVAATSASSASASNFGWYSPDFLPYGKNSTKETL